MITEDKLIKIKHKLSEIGHGGKKQLAEYIGVNQAQISLLLKSGYISPSKEVKVLKWLLTTKNK